MQLQTAPSNSILIIAAQAENIQVLSKILEKEGYQVYIAKNYNQALKKIQGSLPGLIFLDVLLPEINAYSICAQIKAGKELADVPVIFTGALSAGFDKIKAFEAGAVDFIIKPFHAVEVIARTKTHLEFHHAKRDLNKLIELRTAELKKSMEELRKNEQKLSLHVRQTPLAVIEWDTDFRVISWNPAAEKIFGYTAEEAVGRHAEFIVPENSKTQIGHLWDDLLTLSGATRSINQNITKDGRIIYCEWHNTTLRTSGSKIIGAASLALDITDRKRIEQELSESETNFRELLKSAPDPILQIDQNGKILLLNDQTLNLFGYKQKELIGQPIEKLIPSRFRNVHKNHRSKYLKKPSTRSMGMGMELTGQRRDGTEFPILVNLSSVKIGEEYRITTIIRDIREQKKAEQNLKESEQKYRSIFNEARDGIVIIDSETGRILDCNSEFEKMTKRSRSDLVKIRIWELRPRKQIDAAKNTFYEIQRKGRGGSGELEILRSDGTILPVDFMSKRITLLGREVIQSMVRDVTKRRQDEAEIHQRTAELSKINDLGRIVNQTLAVDDVISAGLRAMLDSVKPDYSFFFLREGSNLYLKNIIPPEARNKMDNAPVHRVGECMCGLAATEKKALYSTDIHEDMRCTWKECKEAGTRSFAALPVISGGEVLGVIGLASEEVHDFQKQAVFFEAMSQTIAASLNNAQLYEQIQQHAADLKQRVEERTSELKIQYSESEKLNTQLKKMTKDLKKAADKAEEADRIKSAFLAAMSHELRTPLNSIIGFTGIILQELIGPLNEEQSKQLNMVKNSSRHLLNLINDVLDISKIEAGQLEVHKERFEFPQSIEKVMQSVKPLADAKNLDVILSIAPEISEIVSDQRRVEQILINLLNNAIKFTDKGQIKTECSIHENRLITTVTDTGIGIKEEDLAKLFKEFQQIDTGLNRRHEGTGLGLSISKKLVELLGGRIWVESELGRGSAFSFSLPLEI